jgi:hypothetical protein
MGLNPLLVDTYRTYKKGTENFIQWLAEEAHATGKVDELIKREGHNAVQVTGGRRKGKARKAAKNIATMQAPTTFQVSTKDLSVFATAIANDSRACIPQSVFTTLRAVIRGRKDCASWYNKRSDSEDNKAQEKNENHKFFIQALEDVLEILKVKQPKVINRQPSTARETTQRTPVSNTYELLEVEESIESEEIPDVIESAPQPGQAKRKVIYKLEPSDADVSFDVYCFLKDATNLRLAVRRTWREFAQGIVGLQAAALTTDAAVAMIEKLSDDFEEAHPQFKETEKEGMHEKIINFVYDGYRREKQHSSFIPADSEGEDPFAYKEGGQTLQASTILCFHTLELVFRHITGGKIRLSTDEARFLKTISQIATADIDLLRRPGSIERAAKAILWSAARKSWMLFAIQILWDTQRELGSTMAIAEQTLIDTGKRLATAMQTYLDMEDLDTVGESHKKLRYITIAIRDMC